MTTPMQHAAGGPLRTDADYPERVPDHTPLYTVETTEKEALPHHANVLPAAPAHAPRNRWTRWPFLLFGAVLIAVISGLIGGFIGKTIKSNNASDSASSTTTVTATLTRGAGGTPLPTSSNVALAQAQDTPESLGCPETSGSTVNSSIARVPYKFLCNVNWAGSDLLAIAANNISTCIEACDTYNVYNGASDKGTCVGATWVPAWSVNLTEALSTVQKASSCFLKWQVDGRPAASVGFDAVGICLEDQCPG